MKFRDLSLWGVVALVLGLMVSTPGRAADPPVMKFIPHPCAGAIDVPVQLELAAPDGGIAPGATVTLVGTINSQTDLSNVVVHVSTEGSVSLLGPPDLSLGALQQGMTHVQIQAQFQIPRPLSDGRAAVIATLTASNHDGATYRKEDGVYAITRGAQFRAAEGAYVTAELNAIRADLQAGIITNDDASNQIKAAATVDGAWDQTARPISGLRPILAQDGTDLRPGSTAPAGGLKPQQAPNRVSSGNVTFAGNLSWTARDGSVHPYFGASVNVWEIILGIPIPVDGQATDSNGNYSMTDFVPPLTTCFVDFVTSNSAVALWTGFPIGVPYGAASPPTFDPAGGSTVTWNFTAANTGTGPAAGLHSMVTFEASSIRIRNGGSFLGFIPLAWPGSSGSAFYDGAHINLRPLDRFAYDVMYHEFGHYVMDSFNFENNPGGPHNIGDCIAQVHSSKDQGVRLAWGEGWPTYWGTTVQQDFGLPAAGIPTVGDNVYTDTEAGNFSYSLENNSAPPSSQDSFGLGEDNEIAVQRILWDLVDSNSDGRDNVQISDVTLLNLFHNTNAERLSQVWALIRATLNNTDDLAFSAITTDHGVGPRLTGPGNNAVVSPANKTFTWVGNVGCPSSYTGDSYSVRFYRQSDNSLVTSIPNGGSTTLVLSNAQLTTLIGAGHLLRWAVEGSNSSSPATGPYMGENRNIVADNPPVANAGVDQTVECASHTTTAVLLNGTGSSDPDGDALTYTWSSPGVTFDNNHSATPTGQFSHGDHTVTLVVSDGVLTDSDQMVVHIVDTTPPVLTCPASVVLECNGHCGAGGGVASSDPAVVAFLNGASATDICDASPTVTHSAPPACFPVGVATVIHFTATDHDLNHSDCDRTVTVQDTQPPTISVVLDRTVLWPPNHKMATINATVTVADVCDPNPTFQLISIVSNEPDNGLGDGDTANDIQGASFGTADTQFQLRSERMGGGSGRRYTITYRAFDSSGNTADAVVVVRVPHDQGAGAIAASGWDEDGTGFAPNTRQFALVVRSLPRVVDQSGDPADGQLGTSTMPTGISALLDARAIDVSQAYVGNGAGAIAPLAVARGDVDGDGLQDLVNYYDVQAVQVLQAASTLEDGPIGLHFNIGSAEYLVPDIFALGAPMTLPAMTVTPLGRGIGRLAGGGATAGSASSSTAGDAAAQAPAAATPAPKTDNGTPQITELAGVYPNPVHDDAMAVFSLARGQSVDLAVYDVRGARVRTLVSGALGAGRYQVRWDGRNDAGRRLSGGMYFVRFHTRETSGTHKVVLAP